MISYRTSDWEEFVQQNTEGDVVEVLYTDDLQSWGIHTPKGNDKNADGEFVDFMLTQPYYNEDGANSVENMGKHLKESLPAMKDFCDHATLKKVDYEADRGRHAHWEVHLFLSKDL